MESPCKEISIEAPYDTFDIATQQEIIEPQFKGKEVLRSCGSNPEKIATRSSNMNNSVELWYWGLRDKKWWIYRWGQILATIFCYSPNVVSITIYIYKSKVGDHSRG